MKQRMRRWLVFGLPLLLVTLVSLLYACTFLRPADREALQKVTLALDWTPNTNHIGFYVAQQQGWYREAGIDLQILPYATTQPDTLVAEGLADLGISSSEGVLSDHATGLPVISLAALLQHDTSALVVREESAIRSPADLDGKIYGGFGAPHEEAAVRRMIQFAGGKGHFRNVTLTTGAMEALAGGRVDAVWIYYGVEGVISEATGMRLRPLYVRDYGVPDHYSPVLITSQSLLKHRSELIQKVLQVTARGYLFAETQSKEATRLFLAAVGKHLLPPEAVVRASLEYQRHYFRDAAGLWGVQEQQIWETYARYRLRQKTILNAAGQPVEHVETHQLYTNACLPDRPRAVIRQRTGGN